MAKKKQNQRLFPEISGYREAHDSHIFERVEEKGKVWAGYSVCKCGAQRFFGIIGSSCQDSATEPCPLTDSK